MTIEIDENKRIQFLIESLPYIHKFYGNIIIIKYGGNAMINENLKKSFAKDISLLYLLGMKPVIVHGGGPQINSLLNKLGKEHSFVQGLRVTDKETMDIVEMVLLSINNQIVSLLNFENNKAIGVSGNDTNFIQVDKLKISSKEENNLDIGFVGKIKYIDVSLINNLLNQGYIPIVSPLGIGSDGNTYNINADIVAGELAKAIKATKLIFMTNTKGVLDSSGKIISKLDNKLILALINNKTLHSGMIPKVNAAIDTANNGVNAVHIIDGTIPHSLLLEIFTKSGIGTMIVGDK